MKVIAIERGYFGKLREPGDKFDVPAGEKAPWFVPADVTAVELTPAQARAAKAKADAEAKAKAGTDDLV